jgi:hypothetical protein
MNGISCSPGQEIFSSRQPVQRRCARRAPRGEQEAVMEIESRTIVGAAAAFALVGAAVWGSSLLFQPPQEERAATGTVEIVQVPERSWAVEIKELGATDSPSDATRTAANR